MYLFYATDGFAQDVLLNEKYEKKIMSLTDTPFGYTLSMIGGKWRLVILYWLVEYETLRFNELQRKIGIIAGILVSRSEILDLVSLGF